MSMPSFYPWCNVFRDGCESVVDKPWEWWPSTACNKVLWNTATIIMGGDWRITIAVCNLTQCLNILIGGAFTVLHDNLQIWGMSCRWILCLLRPGQTAHCVTVYDELHVQFQGGRGWISQCDNCRWVIDVSLQPRKFYIFWFAILWKLYSIRGLPIGALVSQTCVLHGYTIPFQSCHPNSSRVYLICMYVKPGTHVQTKHCTNRSRTVFKPNVHICVRDCEPVLGHLQTVCILFAVNRNLSGFCAQHEGNRGHRVSCVRLRFAEN